MRVITGTARGRVLRTLEGEDVRPTTDRVKEAIFSMIQFETEGRRVLDLFAVLGIPGGYGDAIGIAIFTGALFNARHRLDPPLQVRSSEFL